jgi:hypothetical protein
MWRTYGDIPKSILIVVLIIAMMKISPGVPDPIGEAWAL